jgi:putative flippase GtrA
MRREMTTFARFGAVGVANTAITLAVYALLVGIGVPAPAASALGFAVGAANGYVLNRSWTFRADGDAATFVRYVAVQGLGALLSAVSVGVATTDLALHKLVAECVVVPVVALVGYGLARSVVFRPGRRVPASPRV